MQNTSESQTEQLQQVAITGETVAQTPPEPKAEPVEQTANLAEDPGTERMAQMLSQWDQFGVWLAKRDLIIYRNSIERDPHWSWAWGHHFSTGYVDKTGALIAALKFQLSYGEPLVCQWWKRQLRALWSWIWTGVVQIWKWLMA